MPDPNARKRLKKRMLDRWENEGGKIANDDTTSADANTTTSGNQGRSKERSSPRETATAKASASRTKRRTPNRK